MTAIFTNKWAQENFYLPPVNKYYNRRNQVPISHIVIACSQGGATAYGPYLRYCKLPECQQNCQTIHEIKSIRERIRGFVSSVDIGMFVVLVYHKMCSAKQLPSFQSS